MGFEDIRWAVKKCTICRDNPKEADVGFQVGTGSDYLLLGINPKVDHNHHFMLGRGLRLIVPVFNEVLKNYTFDNVIRCATPHYTTAMAYNCSRITAQLLLELRPRYVFLFGLFTTRIMNVIYEPFTIVKEGVVTLPHFSSGLYTADTSASFEEYTKKFKEVVSLCESSKTRTKP